VHGYVGVDAEERRGAEPPEAVEAGEDLVEDDGQAGPGCYVVVTGRVCGPAAAEEV
jgi:hypothetical protein